MKKKVVFFFWGGGIKDIFLNPSKLLVLVTVVLVQYMVHSEPCKLNPLSNYMIFFPKEDKEREVWDHQGGLREYDGKCNNVYSFYLRNEINMRWGDSKNEVALLF